MQTQPDGKTECSPQEFLEILSGKNQEKYEAFHQKYLGVDCVEIDRIAVKGTVEIPKNFKAEKPILINGGKFQDFIIYGGQFQDFIINGGQFQYFIIYGGQFQDFRIYSGQFQYFIIYGGQFQYFIINGGQFQNFRIYGGQFQDFIIYGGEFWFFRCSTVKQTFSGLNEKGTLESKETNGPTAMRFQILAGLIRQAELSFRLVYKLRMSNLPDAQIWLSRSDVRKLVLTGAGSSTIDIADVQPQRIEMDGLQNNAQIFWSRIFSEDSKTPPRQPEFEPKHINGKHVDFWIEPPEEIGQGLEIKESKLGWMEFKNFNFGHYAENGGISVRESNFSQISQYGDFFPVEAERLKTPEASVRAKALSDIYRDLSQAASLQKDTLRRFDYWAVSQTNLYRALGRSQFSQKFAIGFNLWTSDFGRSWLRPLGWVSGLSCLSFSLYLALNCTDSNYWEALVSGEAVAATCKSFEFSFGNFFGYLAEYINPTHRFDFLFEQPAPWSKVLDFLTRLLNGALIYQAILAFRIFTRR